MKNQQQFLELFEKLNKIGLLDKDIAERTISSPQYISDIRTGKKNGGRAMLKKVLKLVDECENREQEEAVKPMILELDTQDAVALSGVARQFGLDPESIVAVGLKFYLEEVRRTGGLPAPRSNRDTADTERTHSKAPAKRYVTKSKASS